MLPSRRIGCLNGINWSPNKKGRCIRNAPALFRFKDHTLLKPDFAPLFFHAFQVRHPGFNVILVLQFIVQDLNGHLVRGVVLPCREIGNFLVPFDGTSFSFQVLFKDPLNLGIGRCFVSTAGQFCPVLGIDHGGAP